LIKIIALLSTLFINLYGALFLFASANKKINNRFYLGLFFLNSFLLFIGHFLTFNGYWVAFRYFDFIFLSSLLAFYPLYCLYLSSAFNFNISSTNWIYHFIPSIIIAIAMLIVTGVSSWESYQIYMNNNLYGTDATDQSSKILAYLYKGSRFFHLLQILFYNFFAIYLIIKAQKNMEDLFSNLDKYQLRFFYIVNISFIVFMSIPGFYVTLIGRTPLNTNDLLLLYVCILFTLLYLILAIIGMKQIPVENKLENSLDQHISGEIHFHELKQIEKNLLEYFSNEKPWLSSNLNIWDVSKKIGTNRSYVSHVINENIGCNFNHFVNEYRLNEAKLLLMQTPEIHLSEISELSGFGSVNSFMRIFKMMENCTPTEFKKRNR
jgi:AraC-like DNA-binding protein